MPAYESLNRDQVMKALGTTHRRLANLDKKYGGVVHEESLEPHRSKMLKIRAEQEGLRSRLKELDAD